MEQLLKEGAVRGGEIVQLKREWDEQKSQQHSFKTNKNCAGYFKKKTLIFIPCLWIPKHYIVATEIDYLGCSVWTVCRAIARSIISPRIYLTLCDVNLLQRKGNATNLLLILLLFSFFFRSKCSHLSVHEQMSLISN